MKKNFKNRINKCRKRLGKNEFARKCNLKPATMLGYLNGTSEPNLKNLIQIAQACNVTVGWLANGEQPKRPGLPVDNHDAKMLRKEMAANGKIAAEIKGPEHVQSNQLHPHDIRHTAASYLIMAGVDLRTLAEILGHKSMDMVMRYAHLIDDHKVSAIDKINGIGF